MYCPKCGSMMDQVEKTCINCGYQKKNIFSSRGFKIFSIILILCSIFFGMVIWQNSFRPLHFHSEIQHELERKSPVFPNDSAREAYISQLEVSELIQLSQPKVFTIFTMYRQGSGFLIDEHGHVLTNAHVVEGDLVPVVRTMDGEEYFGKLVGYSNTTDIAVLYVDELVGKEPLPVEKTDLAKIGDEVIALGSPKGYENTATLGNISGVDRTFVIPPFEYNGIYQTSAPIAPGSSGGPLISRKTGKAIAINSARDNTEITISFSIPLYEVLPLVEKWIAEPMNQEDIYALFYYDDDSFYFQDYLDRFGYFGGDGYYNNEDYGHEEIPEAEYWDDFWEEYWNSYWEDEYNEYMEEHWYDDYRNDGWDDGWFSEEEYWEEDFWTDEHWQDDWNLDESVE